MPVLEHQHWWCASYSPNRDEVLVIDSMESDLKQAFDSHHLSFLKLVSINVEI